MIPGTVYFNFCHPPCSLAQFHVGLEDAGVIAVLGGRIGISLLSNLNGFQTWLGLGTLFIASTVSNFKLTLNKLTLLHV